MVSEVAFVGMCLDCLFRAQPFADSYRHPLSIPTKHHATLVMGLSLWEEAHFVDPRCITVSPVRNQPCYLSSLFLACFFGSVHFYWGSAKNQVFRHHTKSRDGLGSGGCLGEPFGSPGSGL